MGRATANSTVVAPARLEAFTFGRRSDLSNMLQLVRKDYWDAVGDLLEAIHHFARITRMKTETFASQCRDLVHRLPSRRLGAKSNAVNRDTLVSMNLLGDGSRIVPFIKHAIAE